MTREGSSVSTGEAFRYPLGGGDPSLGQAVGKSGKGGVLEISTFGRRTDRKMSSID